MSIGTHSPELLHLGRVLHPRPFRPPRRQSAPCEPSHGHAVVLGSVALRCRSGLRRSDLRPADLFRVMQAWQGSKPPGSLTSDRRSHNLTMNPLEKGPLPPPSNETNLVGHCKPARACDCGPSSGLVGIGLDRF